MRITNNSNYLKEVLCDSLALKTGILLSNNDLIQIAQKRDDIAFPDFIYEDNTPCSIRAEEFESCVLNYRVALGNLERKEESYEILTKSAKFFFSEGIDLNIIVQAMQAGVQLLKPKFINDQIIEDYIHKETGIERMYIQACFAMYAKMQDRNSFGFHPTIRQHLEEQWDGYKSLSKLFDSEILPSDPNDYLDQRFIDYLYANTDDMRKIHWRNFERLVSEFFERLNYHVKIGPGSGVYNLLIF